MATPMVMGYDFFATMARTPRRAAPSTAVCSIMLSSCLMLSSCGGKDQTWTKPVPDTAVAQETPSQNPDEPPPEMTERYSDTDAGVAPLEDEKDEPITVTPAPPPDAGPPAVAFDCSTVPAAPVSFETLEGFTASEDFVFDELGNYAGIDENGNLIRVSKSGEKQLWAPSIGVAAGMGILPDGSVVVCDVREGALKRVYPNGAVSVLLGGLLYPNGLDIGPDGFIYVAENAGGRVRRVNPDTGEFSIVALGLEGPNGVAFTNDPLLLYVGSFEGSGVYKLELPAPGELGTASVFARTPGSLLAEPIIPCPGNEEGANCDTTWYGAGKCQALANVVDCLPIDRCVELPDGAECYYPASGYCQAGRCVEPPNPCDGLAEGASCQDTSGGAGVCQNSFGELFCLPPNPCTGAAAGDACEDPFFGSGTCVNEGGALYCAYPNPCEGRSVGDACEEPLYGAGVCEGEGDYMYCSVPDVCAASSAGDACEDPFFGPGECVVEGAVTYCYPANACNDLSEGDACSDVFTPEGSCLDLTDGLVCVAPNVCDSLSEGAPCADELTFEGVCMETSGHLFCTTPNVCDSLSEGAPCSDEYTADGVCTDYDGRLYCTPPNPCAGLSAGDVCTDPYLGVGAGVCTDSLGELYCQSIACNGLEEGAACEDPLLGPGLCFSGVCSPSGGGGGIDGMGVDTCGNVYATEYVQGNVWRISPAGEMELLVVLPSTWIPNMKWGRDLGGFSSQVMYVADRQEGRLFGIAVGVPGATELFASHP